jgi:protein TonB
LIPSVFTSVRRLQSRQYALCAGGSIIAHAGLFACLLAQPASNVQVNGLNGVDTQPVVEVSLVKAMPTPDTAQEKPDIPVKPQRDRIVRPTPRQPGEAPAAIIRTRTTTVGTEGATRPLTGDPAKTMAAPTPAQAQSAAAIGLDYQRRLLKHIEPFRLYPDGASRRGVGGVVDLMFELDRAGRVLKVWVVHSSGSDDLDSAAVATVERAAPLPPIPSELPNQITVRLPVAFTNNG